MKTYKYIIGFLLLSVFFMACKKNDTVKPGADYANDPIGNFDAFWNHINNSYAFFPEQKELNWEKVYNDFRPLVKEGMSKEDLYKNVFEKMAALLIDQHFEMKDPSLKDSSGEGYSYTRSAIAVNPLMIYLKNITLSQPHYEFELLASTPVKHPLALPDEVASLDYLLGYFKKRKYLYFKMYESFLTALNNSSLPSDKLFMEKLKNALANPDPQTKAFILDLRMDRGGDQHDLPLMASYLMNQDTRYLNLRARIAKGPLGYSDWQPIVAKKDPAIKSGVANLPIVVLTDGATASMGEILTIFMAQNPNTHVIGVNTAGLSAGYADLIADQQGNKKPAPGIIATPFVLKNGLTVILGSFLAKPNPVPGLYENKIFEKTGLPPHEKVEFDNALFQQTYRDTQLEAALNYLKKKTD